VLRGVLFLPEGGQKAVNLRTQVKQSLLHGGRPP
jgi:hypothetical protein